MFRVLKVIFRCYAVVNSHSIPRQGQIFFINLLGAAADPHLGSVAVEVAIFGLVFTNATASRPPRIRPLLHDNLNFVNLNGSVPAVYSLTQGTYSGTVSSVSIGFENRVFFRQAVRDISSPA